MVTKKFHIFRLFLDILGFFNLECSHYASKTCRDNSICSQRAECSIQRVLIQNKKRGDVSRVSRLERSNATPFSPVIRLSLPLYQSICHHNEYEPSTLAKHVWSLRYCLFSPKNPLKYAKPRISTSGRSVVCPYFLCEILV